MKQKRAVEHRVKVVNSLRGISPGFNDIQRFVMVIGLFVEKKESANDKSEDEKKEKNDGKIFF